jgi:hypothetical protein
MPTDYEESPEVLEQITAIVAENNVEFQAIRNHHVRFLGCFKEKTNTDGETVSAGPPVDVKKIGPLHAVFITSHFIIVVDKSRWQVSSEIQKKAMLHHALMTIEVNPGSDGELKFKSRDPDVVEFTTTVERYGAWSEPLLQFREVFMRAGEHAAEQTAAVVTAAAAPEPVAAGAEAPRRRRARTEET